jgi:hypothetical protein
MAKARIGAASEKKDHLTSNFLPRTDFFGRRTRFLNRGRHGHGLSRPIIMISTRKRSTASASWRYPFAVANHVDK